jgi:ribosomal protein S27E
MSIKMPKLLDVVCDQCGETDQAYFSAYGSEQPCLACGAAPVFLSKVSA